MWRALYVAAVAALVAIAVWDPHDARPGLLWLSFALTLPTSIALLAPVYVAAAIAWNLSDADDGGPTWPVTMTYTLALGLIAVANQFVVTRMRRRPRTSPPL